MATKIETAEELKKRLRRRRDELLARKADLMAKGAKARLHGQFEGEIALEIRAIDDELGGNLPRLQEAERQASIEAAGQLAGNSQFQADVRAYAAWLDVLADMVASTDSLLTNGVAVVENPPLRRDFLRGEVSWFQQMARRGAVDSASLPPALRALVGEGG
jgi:hypothetical protein